MKSIGIVTDSHCGMTAEEAKRLGVRVLPMPFYINNECFLEGVSLSREAFFEKLASDAAVSTSQPSPADVMALWDDALNEYEQILYMPISSGLSGSCSTATALAMDEPYEGRVHVVDNGRVSALLHCSILDALELIEEGYSAAEIKKILEDARADMVIYIGVETLEHLKRGGRISPATASLGTLLNIKPVLKFDVGNLDTYQKCRGMKKARAAMIEVMKKELETRFAESYQNKEIYLLAASSADQEGIDSWVAQIKEAFPDLDVLYDDLSLGLCCHIGQGGLGIGCSCKPKRPR